MESRPEEFSLSAFHDRESVGRVLRALADGFAGGQIELSAGPQALALHPDGLLRIRVRAARRGRGGRVSLRVSWRPPDAETSSAPPLEVRAGHAPQSCGAGAAPDIPGPKQA